MEAQRSMNFNEFYRSTGEHLVNICAEECFDKVLYHVNSQILKCKMKNVITMAGTSSPISSSIVSSSNKGDYKRFFYIPCNKSKNHQMLIDPIKDVNPNPL